MPGSRSTFEQLPHTIFDTTATPFTEVNAATLELPADFVRAGTTQQMTTLDASLHPVDVGYDRDTLAVAGDVRLGEHWTTALEYRRQERDGSARGSGSFGFSALEFVQPVDDVTDGVVLSLAYGGERLTGRIAYEASFYSNDNPALTWDNPYPGTETGRMQLAPDNEAQNLERQLRLSPGGTYDTFRDRGRRAPGAGRRLPAVRDRFDARTRTAAACFARRRGRDDQPGAGACDAMRRLSGASWRACGCAQTCATTSATTRLRRTPMRT